MRPFELRALPRLPLRVGWIPAFVVHLVAVALLLRMPLGGRVEPAYLQLVPPQPEAADIFAPDAATRAAGGPVATGGGQARVRMAQIPASIAAAPVAVPTEVPTGIPAPTGAGEGELPPLQLGPLPGDGRLWVAPRPALPAEVAAALYGSPEPADSVAVARLRVMVDSLNEIIDAEQLTRRPPSWTVGEGDGKWGLDQQFIYLGGIKIPTAVLALLGDILPAGNPTEAERAEALTRMREDLLYSARRAQTFEDFRRYVRELRERTDAEREAARRARQRPDTVRAVP